MKRCLILGAGAAGLSVAGFLADKRYEVTLYNRTERRIVPYIENGGYDLVRPDNTKVRIDTIRYISSLEKEENIFDYIIFCLNSNGQAEISSEVYKYFGANGVWILIPGHTFGALSVLRNGQKGGWNKLPTIIEMQALPFVCRVIEETTVQIYQFKKNLMGSLFGENVLRKQIEDDLHDMFGNEFQLTKEKYWASMHNMTIAIQPILLLCNVGRIDKESFLFYRSSSNEYVENLMEAVDSERIKIAELFGLQEILSTKDWLRECYGATGETITEMLKNVKGYEQIIAPDTFRHRFAVEHIETGLVPIEAAAIALGVQVPCITSLINIASCMLGMDLREQGRNIDSLGLLEIL